jgi:hypothetical protein
VSPIALAIAAGILFGAIYLMAEQIQNYLYDQVVAGAWWRSALAAAPLAALNVYRPLELSTMFTEQPLWTVAHVAAWMLLMAWPMLYLRSHAMAVGALGSLLLDPLIAIAIDRFREQRGLPWLNI